VLSSVLREGGRSGQAGLARGRARATLLIAQVALAVMLLIGAGLFLSSFVKLVRVDLGIETSGVLTVSVSPRIDFGAPAERIDADRARAGQQIAAVLERARAIPGVEAVAIASGTAPLSTGWSRSSLSIPGRPKSEDPDDSPDQKSVSADYFKVTRIPVLRGRPFTEADSAPGAEPVIIINDEAASVSGPGSARHGRQATAANRVGIARRCASAGRRPRFGPRCTFRSRSIAPSAARCTCARRAIPRRSRATFARPCRGC
jgi:hypothetical protein